MDLQVDLANLSSNLNSVSIFQTFPILEKQLIDHLKPFTMRVFLVLLATALTLTWAKTPLHVTVNRGIPQHVQHPKKDTSRGASRVTHRLPATNPLPDHYDLKMTPVLDENVHDDYEQYNVYGDVVITITAQATVNRIVLNLHENVDIVGNPVVTDMSDVSIGDALGEKDAEAEFYYIDLQGDVQLVQGGQYKVVLKFISRVHTEADHRYGIYRGILTDADGVESIMLSTQFETTGAREAFPCFDEPWIKGLWKISLGHHPSYIALANNALAEQPSPTHPIPGWFWSHFKVTTTMSAYLVAFLVAKADKYTFVESDANPNVKVFGPAHLVLPSGRNGGAYAAAQSEAILRNFEEYTGIAYPMDKMDSVAIPQFDAGAMENYGLNTYQTRFLLTYGSESFEADRELTTEILSHELIHQWFGNLATCGFWDQIWLNEGFADYFQFHGVNGVSENFKPLELRQFSSTQVGLAYDATTATHPVINDAATEGVTYSDFDVIFTRISYQKGGSLLRMLESVMNPERFKAGLIHYLQAKSGQGAIQDDLFDSLQFQIDDQDTLPAGATIQDIMETWTLQTGFPLVRVSKVADDRIFISQERFTPDVTYTQGYDVLDPDHLWTIPVIVSTPDTRKTCWIDKGSALKSCQVDTSEWLVVNQDGAGFYRVLYDVPLFVRLLEQLEGDDFEVITPNARSQIIDDYFTFVTRQHSRVENALELTKYLTKETAPVVWYTTLFNLTPYFYKLMGGSTEAYDAFSVYMRARLSAVLAVIGIEQPEGETGSNVILRSQLLDWACALGHQECITYATKAFAAWNPAVPSTAIPVDVREVLLCSAVEAVPPNYQIAFDRYKVGTTSAEDKARLLSALACSGDPANIAALLGHVLTQGTEVPAGDRAALFELIAGNTVAGREAAIEFLLQNTAGLIEAVEVGAEGVANIYDTLRNFALSKEQIADLTQLTVTFATELAEVKSRLDSYLVQMETNRAWRDENEERMGTWFTAANTKI